MLLTLVKKAIPLLVDQMTCLLLLATMKVPHINVEVLNIMFKPYILICCTN